VNAEDAFNEFYNSEGVRYYEDLSHKGFMRHAFLHGWAASAAEKISDLNVENLKAVANYNSKMNMNIKWGIADA